MSDIVETLRAQEMLWPWPQQAANEIVSLRARLAEVEWERDRLREALEPFAHFGRFCQPDDENYDDDGIFSSVNLKCGMFRRARAALEDQT